MGNEVAQKVGSDPNETREAFVLRMDAEGYEPSYPGPYELQIDIDNDVHYETFLRSSEILHREMQEFGGIQIVETPSKSGMPCRHIRIGVPFPLDDFQRIAWQAALGSDPVRELLSCLRALRGDAHPTLLIEKKGWNNAPPPTESGTDDLRSAEK
jgi:hypothetical protein